MPVIRALRVAAGALVALSFVGLAGADTIIVNKIPTDVCLFCLDGFPNGPIVLAGSFVFDGPSGTLLRTVGAYMQRAGDGPRPGSGTPFRFAVFGDNMNQLDPLAVLASPESRDASDFPGDDSLPPSPQALGLVTALLDVPVSLVNGARYWIAATTLPFSTQGSYHVGLLSGSGAFAVSFDPSGMEFFGAPDVGLDPLTDLAIYASGAEPVPEPATLTLLAAGMLALGLRNHKTFLLRTKGRRTGESCHSS